MHIYTQRREARGKRGALLCRRAVDAVSVGAEEQRAEYSSRELKGEEKRSWIPNGEKINFDPMKKCNLLFLKQQKVN
jgi:hypothetical protein